MLFALLRQYTNHAIFVHIVIDVYLQIGDTRPLPCFGWSWRTWMPTMVDMATPLRSPRSVPKLLWTPSVNKSCKMDEFMVLVNDRYSLEIGNASSY